jgi:hypothetical protein
MIGNCANPEISVTDIEPEFTLEIIYFGSKEELIELRNIISTGGKS